MVKEGGSYTSTRRPSLIVGSYANSLPFDLLMYLRYTDSCRSKSAILLIVLSVLSAHKNSFKILFWYLLLPRVLFWLKWLPTKNVFVAHYATKHSCDIHRSSKTLSWHTLLLPKLFWYTLYTHILFWRTPLFQNVFRVIRFHDFVGKNLPIIYTTEIGNDFSPATQASRFGFS
jgi:hypothetical protein